MAKEPTKTFSKSAEKRAIFVREYAIDKNGTRAAIAAGFSAKSAAVTASKLLKNPKVKAELAELISKAMQRLDVTLDRVLQEEAKLALRTWAITSA